MDSKILPVATDVVAIPDIFMANMLSVIKPNTINFETLLMNKFVQLFYRNFLDNVMLNFYTDIPLLWKGVDEFDINDDEIAGLDLLTQIKLEITRENYISVFLNDTYIPKALCDDAHGHDYLFYGFNNEKEELYAIMFDLNYEFTKIVIQYNEFLEGYEHRPDPPYTYRTVTIEKGHDYGKDDDRKTVINLLQDYVNSSNSFDWYINGDCGFGISIYRFFADKVKLSAQNATFLDHRDFIMLNDHKVLMHRRLKTYFKEPYLSQKYETIVQDAEMLKNIALKNRLFQSQYNSEKILATLSSMQETEYKILTEALTHNL